MWVTHIHLRTPFQTAEGFSLFFPGYFSFHTPDVPTPQGVTAQPRHVQRHRHSALGVEREGSPSYRDVDCCGCEDVVFCCLSRFMLKMLFSYVFMLFSYSTLSSRSMWRCCLFLFIARFWCWCKVKILEDTWLRGRYPSAFIYEFRSSYLYYPMWYPHVPDIVSAIDELYVN